MKPVLVIAAGYNLAWSIWAGFFTNSFVEIWVLPSSPTWKWLSIGVALMALVYLVASRNPVKGWKWASIGFVTKVVGAFAAVYLIMGHSLPWSYIGHILFNDLIWLPFLAIIGYRGFKASQDTSTENGLSSLPGILEEYTATNGKTLKEVTADQPTLIVFLRHFGCTFCKEALADLRSKIPQIEQEGTKLVLVHMASPELGKQYFQKFQMNGHLQISDPTCKLYEAFSLQRANFQQVFGIKSWVRGAEAFLRKGHGIGKLVGDGFRMPGVFLVYKGETLKGYRHQNASDIPAYQELASCPIPS